MKRGLPYWGVVCCALFVAGSQVFLKMGVDDTQTLHSAASWLEIQGLVSRWILAGILCYIMSFVFLRNVLKVLPRNMGLYTIIVGEGLVPSLLR